jgi:hypothetical protein
MAKKMNLRSAVRFIRRNGDLIEKARLSSILWHEVPSKEVMRRLMEFQEANGGFAYWCPQVSNVCDTAYILQWLDDLRIYEHDIAQAACRFLLERQHEDGGWDEVREVGNYPCPEWMIPGRLETRTWLTGFCSLILILFGYAEAPGSRCPADFILSHSDERGRVAGFERATSISLPMLAFYPGLRSEDYQRALSVAEDIYSPEWPGAQIAWLLRCLKDAQLPIDHALVRRAIADLESSQRPDGSWEPESGEGEEHAVNATVSALGSLHAYERVNLNERFQL